MKIARTLILGLVPLFPATLVISATAQEPPRSAPEMFAATCAFCHDPGGWGTRKLAQRVPEGEAALLDRRSLPPALTRLAVRRGIGSMPPLTPTDLTDEELDRLARWLDEKN